MLLVTPKNSCVVVLNVGILNKNKVNGLLIQSWNKHAFIETVWANNRPIIFKIKMPSVVKRVSKDDYWRRITSWTWDKVLSSMWLIDMLNVVLSGWSICTYQTGKTLSGQQRHIYTEHSQSVLWKVSVPYARLASLFYCHRKRQLSSTKFIQIFIHLELKSRQFDIVQILNRVTWISYNSPQKVIFVITQIYVVCHVFSV